MIVCVCNALCENRCREAACNPECRSVGSIYRRLGARVRCGKCLPTMEEVLADAKRAAVADQPGLVVER